MSRYRTLRSAFGWALAACSMSALAAGSGPATFDRCDSVEVKTASYDAADGLVDDRTLPHAAQALADLRGRFAAEPTQFALAAGLRHADYLLRARFAQLFDGRQHLPVQARSADRAAPIAGAVAKTGQRAAATGTMR